MILIFRLSGNEVYSRLLRAELFGSDFGSFSKAGSGHPMSPSKNMLRFKTESLGPNSPYSPYDMIMGFLHRLPRLPSHLARSPRLPIRYALYALSGSFLFCLQEIFGMGQN